MAYSNYVSRVYKNKKHCPELEDFTYHVGDETHTVHAVIPLEKDSCLVFYKGMIKIVKRNGEEFHLEIDDEFGIIGLSNKKYNLSDFDFTIRDLFYGANNELKIYHVFTEKDKYDVVMSESTYRCPLKNLYKNLEFKDNELRMKLGINTDNYVDYFYRKDERIYQKERLKLYKKEYWKKKFLFKDTSWEKTEIRQLKQIIKYSK